MEADGIDVLIMLGEYAETGNMVCAPQSRGLVMGAGEKVVAKRTPGHIPDWMIVPFVDHEASPCVKRPEPDGLICG